MKDPADKVTIEMFSEEAGLGKTDSAGRAVMLQYWGDERRELLDMLEKVLASGWELGVCIEAQTLVRKLRAIDAACEAEFSNNEKSGNV